jgi:excisionase family DNA binding protein
LSKILPVLIDPEKNYLSQNTERENLMNDTLISMLETAPANEDEFPQLLTAKDIAGLLRISRSQAFELLRNGDISSYRLGRNVRVRKEDVLKYLQQNYRPSSPANDQTIEQTGV